MRTMRVKKEVNSVRVAITAWEKDLVEGLLNLIDDVVPGDIRKSSQLHTKVQEVFDVAFDIADREKPTGGTDKRKGNRPSQIQPTASFKKACTDWAVRRSAALKVAWTSWQQKLLEGVIDLCDEHVPGGLSGLMDKRTKFRVNRVMDMATLHMKPAKKAASKAKEQRARDVEEPTSIESRVLTILNPTFQKNWSISEVEVEASKRKLGLSLPKLTALLESLVKKGWLAHRGSKSDRKYTRSFTKLTRKASIKVAFTGWQKKLLEDIMDLVDDYVPGGQMNANRVWRKINEIFDLVWNLKAKLRKRGFATPVRAPGNFLFIAPSERVAALVTALVQWQQQFLEGLVIALEDAVPGGKNGGWVNKKDEIEEVFEQAFKMVKHGDLVYDPKVQELPDGEGVVQPPGTDVNAETKLAVRTM